MFETIVGVSTVLVAFIAVADFALRWLCKPLRADK
jgi:hypothetical protein